MLTAHQHFQNICAILHECCGVEGTTLLELDLSLQGDLGLDSIGLLNLVTELEEHYDFRLDEPLESPPQTLRDVVALVEARVGGPIHA